jgi:hypothetical protein
MSKRELIAQNLADTLKNQQVVRLGTVTRDPGIEVADLAATAFPAVLILAGNESRESITQGGSNATRECTLEVVITVWTSSNNRVDTQLNSLIESIEELIEVDATRGGNALDTQLRNIAILGAESAPRQRVELTFEIQYLYTKGNA